MRITKIIKFVLIAYAVLALIVTIPATISNFNHADSAKKQCLEATQYCKTHKHDKKCAYEEPEQKMFEEPEQNQIKNCNKLSSLIIKISFIEILNPILTPLAYLTVFPVTSVLLFLGSIIYSFIISRFRKKTGYTPKDYIILLVVYFLVVFADYANPISSFYGFYSSMNPMPLQSTWIFKKIIMIYGVFIFALGKGLLIILGSWIGFMIAKRSLPKASKAASRKR